MKRIILLTICISLLTGVEINAQFRALKSIPDRSPFAKKIQKVGITEIAIEYFSPSAKGRKIFGGQVVPYNEGKPFPWRAGANENTVVSFSDDVTIDGKELKAGKYGLHIIPAEDEWTMIFSNNASSFGNAGSFHMYNPVEDALRIKVKSMTHEFRENLSYDFINRTDSTVQIALRWEETSVPFTISVDVKNIVAKHIKEELRGTAGLAWEGWNAAAQYCLNNNFQLEQGLQWAKRSISGGWDAQPTFANLSTKALLEFKLDKKEEAKETLTLAKKYIISANNWDVVDLAITASKEGLNDEALDLLKNNNEIRSEFWGSHYGLGIYYSRKGDAKKALKILKSAHEICKNEGAKKWLAGQLQKVEAGNQI